MALSEQIQKLIDNPMVPNPSEWAMDCEDALNELEDKAFFEQSLEHIDNIQKHNGAFPQHIDMLVAILKRALRSISSPDGSMHMKQNNSLYVDPVENTLEASYREFFESFEPDTDYEHLYISVENEHLRVLFSTFHYELNRLFNEMNKLLPTGEETQHYWANESRELLLLIRTINKLYNNFENSQYAFEINEYYKKLFDECLTFLKNNGGSTVPAHHSMIDLVYVAPLFSLIKDNSMHIPNRGKNYKRKLIGRGSYASVFKYKDDFYDIPIAVKGALRELDQKELERFKREYEIMKSLSSPYILKVYAYDEERHEYTMEYMDETLKKYISENNDKLDWGKRKGIAAQVLRGFVYTQNKGLLHRDISPNNLLIKKYDDGSVVVKISDFGLVKIPNSTLTSYESEIKGAFNDPALRRESFANYDIYHESYALTLIVYFIMTGRVNLDREANKSLKAFLDKGLNSQKEQRYKNAEEILAAVHKLSEEL